MPLIGDIVRCIEEFAPPSYQESYDNAGLQVGNMSDKATGVLLALDITEEIVDEAIKLNANLIISHHPLIFNGLKNITGDNYVTRIIVKAIRNSISIFSCHTNIDNIGKGVNLRIGEKLGLRNIRVLKPTSDNLSKLVFFVPTEHADRLREVVFEAGAGHIGNYDCCSYNGSGNGSFRALENTNPYVGEKNELHFEPEIRIETIFPKHLEKKIVSAIIKAHPYEEVAYDIYPLQNSNQNIGSGAIGNLDNPLEEIKFLQLLKDTFQIPNIRHSPLTGKYVSKVAFCGGSGSFLIKNAIHEGANAYITGDLKYHQFFDADKKIILADIGHFESEQFTLEIFYELLTKNFSNFAICFTKVRTNPINYF